jgi:hypothetical protein
MFIVSAGPFALLRLGFLGDVLTQKKVRTEERLNRPALTFGTVVLAMLMSGCASVHKTIRHLPTPTEIGAVVVYPVETLGMDEHSAWNDVALAQRLIDAGLGTLGTRLAFFGPTEFEVKRASENNAWVTSTAVALLVKNLQRPEKCLVLRTRLERRKNSQIHEKFDAKGRAVALSSGESVEWLGSVELIHPSSATVIFEASDRVLVDTLTAPDDTQLDDAQTRLLLSLSNAAFEHLKTVAGASKAEALGATLGATASSFPKVQSQGDALMEELAAQARSKLLLPRLTDAQLVKASGLPAGILVLQAPQRSGLLTLDFIESIDGETALPQVLYRKHLLGPVQMVVRRLEKSIPLTIP